MGVMIVRIINDGPITLPMMRMHPPVPEGWTSDPELIDVPSIVWAATSRFASRSPQTVAMAPTKFRWPGIGPRRRL